MIENVKNSNEAQKPELGISDVSGSFKDAAALLKEITTLMAFKYLLNVPHTDERAKDEEWLRGVGKVVTWMENYH